MVGKMESKEKIWVALSFALLLIAIIAKCVIGTADMGVFVMLAFTGILVWLIFLVCAFVPVDWRMTDKQKSKIQNPEGYQNKYRKIMIVFDMVVSVLFSGLILFLG